MELTTGLAAAQEQITQALVATTRAVTSVIAEDLDFHRASDRSVTKSLDKNSGRLLRLTEKLLSRATADSQSTGYRLRDVDAIDANWRRIVDAGDQLFEQADVCLDQYTGLVKRADPQDAQQPPVPKPRRKKLDPAWRSPDISKPQLLFDDAPYNHVTEPFRPFISSKPHAIVPLEQSYNTSPGDEDNLQYQHPYQREIEEYQYPNWVYSTTEPIYYSPFDTTQATFVDDLDGVHAMLEELKGAREVAIDLEHHDTHSYIGIVSLMQISTRDHDWIVDTLKPWRRKLQVLNEVFADPNILKVMHGTHMDMLWLQRDLGLYVVGLFDTYHAACVLGYAGGSLAFLLQKIAHFDAQKQFQLADWRMRPLPSEMLEYARSDTHFLLYIYDCMRNELMAESTFRDTEGDRILEVLKRSKQFALERYEHPFYNDKLGARRNGWFNALSRQPSHMSQEQLAVFARIHQWRDTVARQEDESINYVMAHQVLVNIAWSVPHTKPALLSLIHPLSPPVKLRADELMSVIDDAKAGAAHAPRMDDILAHLPYRHHFAANKLEAPVPPAQVVSVPNKSSDGVDGDCRTHESCFWGTALYSSGVADSVLKSTSEGHYHVLFPASQTNTAGAHGNITDSSNHSFQASTNVFEPLAEARSVNGAGVSAQVLGKRKLVDEGPDETDNCARTTSATGESIGYGANEEAMERVRKRADRKARKRAKKSHRNGLVQGDDVISLAPPEPFDYESAPSLLRTPRGQRLDATKGFDPFAKAADAPSGLSRSQNPKEGKSSTFRWR